MDVEGPEVEVHIEPVAGNSGAVGVELLIAPIGGSSGLLKPDGTEKDFGLEVTGSSFSIFSTILMNLSTGLDLLFSSSASELRSLVNSAFLVLSLAPFSVSRFW